MDVVYINQYYHTPAMKGGTRAYEFSRRLALRGHRVNVITSMPVEWGTVDERWIVTEEAGVTVNWCGVPYSHHMSAAERLRSFAGFAVRSSLRARTLPQDVVFATSTPLTVAIPGITSARWNGVPMVFEVRDVWPEVPIAMGMLRNPGARRVAHALESLAYHQAESVVALSPDMADSVRSRFPRTPVTVIPNSSDHWLFAAPDRSDVEAIRADRPWLGDRPLLVYAGAFGPANGVAYLAEMAATLRRVAPEVRVLLVGEGKDGAALEAQARRLDVWRENLFVEPPVPKERVPAFLAAADMCASVFADIPALRANSPNKVFDAFAAGRPVMINNGGWLGEILDESGAGVVVPGDDPAAAAHRLAARITDPAWLRSAGAAASGLAADRFNRDLLFEEFEETLVRAVEGRVGAARPPASA